MKVVYKGLDCIEASRVPKIDLSFKAVSNSNTLMKFDRN